MITVYTRISGLRNRELFRPWLYKIARNVFLQWLRHSGREMETRELYAAVSRAESQSAEPFHTLQFSQWMAALEADERQIISLRCLEEREYRDIAEDLGLPLGTVQWKIFNSKKKLARRFGTAAVPAKRLRGSQRPEESRPGPPSAVPQVALK